MYFLRRRHGRKNQSDQRARRGNPPPQAMQGEPQQMMHQPYPEPVEYRQEEELVAPRPVVITKTRRARVEMPEEANDFAPAGTFRAGTLHIAHAAQAAERHGKL